MQYRRIRSFGNTQFKSIARKEYRYVVQTSLFSTNPTYATILNSIVFLLLRRRFQRYLGWHVVGGTRDGFMIEREWLLWQHMLTQTVIARYAKM